MVSWTFGSAAKLKNCLKYVEIEWILFGEINEKLTENFPSPASPKSINLFYV
jgi:hypothetical protein